MGIGKVCVSKARRKEIKWKKNKATKSLICQITSAQATDNEDFVKVSASILAEISGSVSEEDQLHNTHSHCSTVNALGCHRIYKQ